MMFLIGIAMMGGYFGLVSTIIPALDAQYPSLSVLAFILISIGYAWCAMRLQTRLERYYIRRHVRKNPDSLWRYAAARLQ